LSDLPKSIIPKNEKHILLWNHIEVARQITLYEFEIFKNIEPIEVLNLNWNNKKNNISKNVKEMIEWFNQFSGFISKSICEEKNTKKRVILLKKVISLGMEFLNLNNFNSLICVVSALNASSVRRLKKTWMNLEIKYTDQLKEIETYCESKGNFHTLRNGNKYI
jgi:hypothetical protein